MKTVSHKQRKSAIFWFFSKLAIQWSTRQTRNMLSCYSYLSYEMDSVFNLSMTTFFFHFNISAIGSQFNYNTIQDMFNFNHYTRINNKNVCCLGYPLLNYSCSICYNFQGRFQEALLTRPFLWHNLTNM